MTGDTIKRRRVVLGLTQSQLAEVLGVAAGTVSRWERCGAQDVSLEVGQERILVALESAVRLGGEAEVGKEIREALALAGGLRAMYLVLRRFFGD